MLLGGILNIYLIVKKLDYNTECTFGLEMNSLICWEVQEKVFLDK